MGIDPDFGVSDADDDTKRNSFSAASHPILMAVVNLSLDSFSGDGVAFSIDALVEHLRRQEAAGAHVLDIGAESTRPGFAPVSGQEELARLRPLFTALQSIPFSVPISIDTSKGDVAERALQAGATIINDVSCGADARLLSAVARHGAELILMHGRNQSFDSSRPGVSVAKALFKAMRAAVKAGVQEERITLDPGLGFGKEGSENWQLLKDLDPLRALGRPILVGLSRKRFLAPERVAADREEETQAACALAVALGADALRVHDVAGIRRHAQAAWSSATPSFSSRRFRAS